MVEGRVKGKGDAGLALELVQEGRVAGLDGGSGGGGGQEIATESRGGAQIGRGAVVLEDLGHGQEGSDAVEWELVLAGGDRRAVEGLDDRCQDGDMSGPMLLDVAKAIPDLGVKAGVLEAGKMAWQSAPHHFKLSPIIFFEARLLEDKGRVGVPSAEEKE